MTTQGERFHYMRTEILNLTQAQLAEKINDAVPFNFEQSHVAHIETGRKQTIPNEVLLYLCQEHLINVEWLLLGTGNITKVEDYEEYTRDENDTEGDSCDCVDIKYWEGLPVDLKRPQITSIHADLELIETDWLRPLDSLRVIPMLDNGMNTYWYPLQARHMLVIDLNSTDINKKGVYLFTTNKGNNLYVRLVSLDMDGSVKIQAFENGQEWVRTLSVEEQKEVDFTIIGRMIKNVSLTV